MPSIYTDSTSANSVVFNPPLNSPKHNNLNINALDRSPDFSVDHGPAPTKADLYLFDHIRQTYTPTTYFVSALCGAGKTVGLADLIAEETHNPFTKNFLYVCPTVQLMNEFSELLAKRRVRNVRSFYYHENLEQTVASAVISYCKSINMHGGGNVILITHTTYFAINRFFDRHHWDIYIDEPPQITQFNSENIEHSHVWLKKIIKAKPYNAELIELTTKDNKEFEKYLNSKDSGVNAFRDLLKYLNSDSYRVFAKITAFDALEGYDGRSIDGKEYHLPYVAELKPQVFDGVTVMGAELEKHMLNDLLKRAGHNIIEDNHITSRLSYREYPPEMAARLTMLYLLEQDYSKTKAKNKRTTQDKLLRDAMHEIALAAVNGEPFVYLTNKNDKGPLFDAENGKPLPHKSSGLNEYREYKIFVSVAAFRRDYTDHSLHIALGYSDECIRYTTQVVDIHQAMMRTNLREKDSTAQVLAIISDAYGANQLATIIGCAKPSKLGDIQITRDCKKIDTDKLLKLSSTERNQNANANKIFKKLGLIDSNKTDCEESVVSMLPSNLICKDVKSHIQTTNITHPAKESHTGISQAEMPKAIRVADRSSKKNEYLLLLTMHTTVFETKPEAHRTASFTISEFDDSMRKLHSRTLADKKKARMFNPSLFDTFSPYDEYRVKSNFVSAAFVVLDFDTGTTSPERVEEVFWTNANELTKLCFIICNSFSRSAQQPNRFRMIVPLTKPITNIASYERIVDWLHSMLLKHLSSDEESGLDPQSRNAVQSYYLPCTNQEHREHAFLRSYGMNNRDFKKYGLNPSGFERSIPRMVVPNSKAQIAEPLPLDNQRLAALQPEIDALTAMTEGRHRRYFLLTRKLQLAGVPEWDAVPILLGIAKGQATMIRKMNNNIAKVYHGR
jgi:hypothetical protein